MSPQPTRATEVVTEEYAIGDVIPVDGIEAVPKGTNLLVLGPSMLGHRKLALDILGHGLSRGEHAVVVTPDQSADRIRDRFEDQLGSDAGTLQIVDCSAGGSSALTDTDQVKSVSAPHDLTGIGIALVKSTQAIGDAATDGVRVSLLSLTTLLQYTDLERVFNFVCVVTGRLAAAGYLSVATMDTTAHDTKTLNTMKAQFDGVVELREAESGQEIRVQGFSDVSTEWRPF